MRRFFVSFFLSAVSWHSTHWRSRIGRTRSLKYAGSCTTRPGPVRPAIIASVASSAESAGERTAATESAARTPGSVARIAGQDRPPGRTGALTKRRGEDPAALPAREMCELLLAALLRLPRRRLLRGL